MWSAERRESCPTATVGQGLPVFFAAQTKNALALVQKDAALYVADAEARRTLLPLVINTVSDANRLDTLSRHILQLARPDAASAIADEVIALARRYKDSH